MRLSGTKTGSINQYRGLGDQLWDLGGARPSLDLNFAHSKSLVDATTGSNLVDFTRASSGTYVGSDGLIKTATTNLLLQSEDFSTTWSNFASSDTVNVATAPDGTLSADKLIPDNATSTTASWIFQDKVKIASPVTYTFSAYCKAAEFDAVRILFSDSATGIVDRVFAEYSLLDGSEITAPSTNGTFSAGSGGIVDTGNGWYRVFITALTSTETLLRFRLYARDSSATDGDGTSGIYVWGAQLEQSDTVGEYVKTTSTINSAPRFDHDPTTGESLGLLVEESRTNLYPYSEDFSQSDWFAGRVTVTTDAVIAPDGTLTADALTETTSTGEHYVNDVINVTSGQTYTVSWFAKANGRNHVYCKVFTSFPISSGTIDLETGTFTAIAGSGITDTSWKDYGNGWYRVSFTATANATGVASILVGMAQSATTNSYTGDSSLGMYVWGAQLETGSFPTSYIPTSGSTVTRAADVASISGSNFSSWYRQDEGTVFAEGSPLISVDPQGILSFNNNTNIEAINLYFDTGIRFQVRDNNATQAFISQSYLSSLRACAAFEVNNFALSDSGRAASTDLSGSTPTPSQFRIGALSSGANFWNGSIRRLTYWPTRLGDGTLQTITQ